MDSNNKSRGNGDEKERIHCDMVELHMDTCHIFEERANDETKFGGNLCARKKQEEKPLIMWT